MAQTLFKEMLFYFGFHTLKTTANFIRWENPTLNKQLKHADLTLSF